MRSAWVQATAVNPNKGHLHLGTGMYVVTVSIIDEGHWYTYPDY